MAIEGGKDAVQILTDQELRRCAPATIPDARNETEWKVD
jgi:hypothetical protein